MPNEVEIRLRASGQQTAKDAVAQVTGSIEKLRSTVAGLSPTMAAFAGRLAYEGVAALKRFAIEGLRTAEQMKEAAEKTGMSASGYQKLAYAASMTGSSMGAVDVALRTLQVNLAEGDKSLAAMGLDFAVLSTLSPDEQFRRVAEAIAKIPGQAQRTQAAVQAFGRWGQELLPMIDSLRTLSDEAESLGLVLDEKALAAAERFNETWKKLRLQAQSKLVLAVEYVTEAKDGDREKKATVAGLGLGTAGGAIIGGVLGGSRGAKIGALAGAAVTKVGQDAAKGFANAFTGIGEEEESAERRAAAVDREVAEREAREKAETAKKDRRNAAAGKALEAASVAKRKTFMQGQEKLKDAYDWVDDREDQAAVGGVGPDADADRRRASRLKAVGEVEWIKAGRGDPLKGVKWLEDAWKAEEEKAQEVIERQKELGEEIAATEKRLADDAEQEKDRRTRESIAAERRRVQEVQAAAEAAAREHRATATRLAREAGTARAALLAPPADRRETESEARTEKQTARRLDREIASARRRERELAMAPPDDESPRSRLSRRGQELLAYDDSRRQARRAERGADVAERQAERGQKKTEADLEALRRMDLAVGRDQVKASVELTAELARLRGELAKLTPGAQAPATPGAQAPASAYRPPTEAEVSTRGTVKEVRARMSKWYEEHRGPQAPDVQVPLPASPGTPTVPAAGGALGGAADVADIRAELQRQTGILQKIARTSGVE